MIKTFNLLLLSFFFVFQLFGQSNSKLKTYTSLEDYYDDFCPAYKQILAAMPANFEKIKGEKTSSSPMGVWKTKVLLPMCSAASIHEREVGCQMEFDFGSSADSMVALNAFAILKNALLYCRDTAWTFEQKPGENNEVPGLINRFIMYDKVYQNDPLHLRGSYVYVDWIKNKDGLFNLELNFYHL
jgi:hypothetical protein